MRTIDLNCDLGEGGADDDALLQVITSANVACGFHAGDDATMAHVCAEAASLGVSIGAQVSYRDRNGFGRRFIDVDYSTLRDDITEQIGALRRWATEAGTRVRYVKPHGALYHACSKTPEHAKAVLDAMRAMTVDSGEALILLAAAGSPFIDRAARSGVRAVAEAFADRGYADDLTLVPRTHPDALVTDARAAAAQARAIAVDESVRTVTGATVAVSAGSVCVHSDTPGALDAARAVLAALTDAGVVVAPFA